MNKRIFLTTLSALTMACGIVTSATADALEESNHSVGASINSFGLGASYTYKFRDNLHLRATLHGISSDDAEAEFSGIDYDGEVDSVAAGILLDWYPSTRGWKRKLFISGGLMYVHTEFEGTAQAGLGESINVGGVQVNPGDIQSLDLKIKNEPQTVPYLGIGWNSKGNSEPGFAFVSEIGLIYLDDPDVTLAANDPDGVLSPTNLAAERRAIIDDGADGGLSAFLSLGVSYHF